MRALGLLISVAAAVMVSGLRHAASSWSVGCATLRHRGLPLPLRQQRRVQTVSLGARGLDLSDVLESNEEVMNEFISSLRSQMGNTLNANPRAITNRVKAFFGGVRSGRSEGEIETFRTYLAANSELLDVVSAVLLIEGCTRSNLPPKELVDLQALLNAMERPSQLLTSSMIYRGFSCLNWGKAGGGASSSSSMSSSEASEYRQFQSRFASLLVARIEESGVLLNETDICPALYSLSQLNAQTAAGRRLIKYCAASMAAITTSFPSKSLCSAVFGLRKMHSHPEVRLLLAEIAKKIAASEALYHPINVCVAINGLQSMSDEVPEVRAVLAALLAQSILADEQGMDRAGDREISMALMGLKEMGGGGGGGGGKGGGGNDYAMSLKQGHRSDASKELRAALRYITSLLREMDGSTDSSAASAAAPRQAGAGGSSFEAKRLGFALLGLQGLSSRTPEVRELLTELAPRAAGCTGAMSGQEVSMSLRGLAGLDSDDQPVRALIRHLVPLVKSCERWDSSDCQSALLGLKSLKYTSQEVNKLADAVAGLIERSNGGNGGDSSRRLRFFTAEQVGASLNGMQGLGSMTAEARRLLACLPSMMAGVPREEQSFTGRDVSVALYGLRQASCQQPETLAVLEALLPFVRNTRGYVSAQHFSSALCGLQNLDSSTSSTVRAFLVALAPVLETCKSGTMSAKAVSKAMNGLQRLRATDKETDADVLRICDALAAVLERSVESFGASEGGLDSYQLSAAVSGLANKDPMLPAVLRLGNALAKLLHRSSGAGSSSAGTATSPERLALALYSMQGLGASVPGEVVVRGAAALESTSSAGNSGNSGGNSGNSGGSKLQYKQLPFAVTIMEAMLGPLRLGLQASASGSGSGIGARDLGKMFQAFKGVVSPSAPYLTALELLADRMETRGWSLRGSGGGGGAGGGGGKNKAAAAATSASAGAAGGASLLEAQASLRSILTGISSLRRDLPVRHRLLRLLSAEAQQWPAAAVERRTLDTLSATFYYRGKLLGQGQGEGEGQNEVTGLLTALDARFKECGLGPYFKAYEKRESLAPRPPRVSRSAVRPVAPAPAVPAPVSVPVAVVAAAASAPVVPDAEVLIV